MTNSDNARDSEKETRVWQAFPFEYYQHTTGTQFYSMRDSRKGKPLAGPILKEATYAFAYDVDAASGVIINVVGDVLGMGGYSGKLIIVRVPGNPQPYVITENAFRRCARLIEPVQPTRSAEAVPAEQLKPLDASHLSAQISSTVEETANAELLKSLTDMVLKQAGIIESLVTISNEAMQSLLVFTEALMSKDPEEDKATAILKANEERLIRTGVNNR